MLRLVNVKKDYVTASETVHALKGIDLSFRQAEFVSILGPSGCGKTTLLNIIGGLDHYTSGDLIINGRSTKNYCDRDWDVYRNHRIGFIFQSYNLIPHQTVLGNVELALTISGIGKEERVRRAKEALDRVGLSDQYYKRPNQLSGGQCQRVAIARAIVNNPEILLADEPTGALDSVTSVQIMDLIREIAKERLVIMVTHNPELAEKYSTRIIRLFDGEVIEDSMPFSPEAEKRECKRILRDKIRAERDAVLRGEKKKKKKSKEKAKMSGWTSFRLSARNLFSKKGRTAMVGFAGSIGIIGIALVLALSAGIRGYIASMQDDMLSGNPITVSEQTRDLTALMSMMTPQQRNEVSEKLAGHIYISSLLEYIADTQSTMQSSIIKNDINDNYLQFIEDVKNTVDTTVLYDYGLDVENNIYASFSEHRGDPSKNYSLSTIRNLYTGILSKTEQKELASYIGMLVTTFKQAPNDPDYILSQYNVLEGNLAKEKNEIMLVISKDQTLSDLLLANLGVYAQDEFINLIYRGEIEKLEKQEITEYDKYDPNLEIESFPFSDLLGTTFTYHPNDLVFVENTDEQTKGTRPFFYNYEGSAITANDDSVELKIVGILQPKENISFGSLAAGIYYTEALTEHILDCSVDSKIAQYIDSQDSDSFRSAKNLFSKKSEGIFFDLEYHFEDETHTDTVFVGQSVEGGLMGLASQFMGSMTGAIAGMPTSATLYLRQVGGVDRANSISIYPRDFEQKDVVTAELDRWNSSETITLSTGVELKTTDRADVKYNDPIETIITLIDMMITIVTSALIAFTSISLVVSTIMIGIITYVSVVERIKEIGVIRALGGRKRDVSRLFNAEAFILGLLSGGFGIGVSYLVCFIASTIVESLTAVPNIAFLPWWQALILIALSVFLTSISGLMPASSAAKKDPVVALRTE